MNKALSILAIAALAATAPLAGAFAADHQVQMLNKDSEGRPMQFEPAFLKVSRAGRGPVKDRGTASR